MSENKVCQHFSGREGSKIVEKVMTDIDIKSADMGEGGVKNSKKVLTYFMDGPYV